MIGSKRLDALEDGIAAVRAALQRQEGRTEAAEAAAAMRQVQLDEARERAEIQIQHVATLAARLDIAEADLGGLSETTKHLVEAIAFEQAQRNECERIIAKLERRIDEQAEEARVTATALLQRLDSVLRSRAGAKSSGD